MALSDYLSPERVLIYQGTDKGEMIELLVDSVCRECGDLDPVQVGREIEQREEQLSSRLAPGIALPHMVLGEERRSVLAAGLSRDGIQWDPSTEEKVHLVLLLVGGRSDHLPV
ncbi:MAG TPA: PTS sugar transporter subunit IIA, partial [Sediminispirochaeta sp.]|nr:PTS sugar transporter subunit IIA [Sediminispirochaeta sp.]